MREEYINALQNFGAALFFIGFAINRVVDGVTQLVLYVISTMLMIVGIVLIAVAQWVISEEDRRKEQKNKGRRTAKH